MRVASRLPKALLVMLAGSTLLLSGCSYMQHSMQRSGANMGLRFAENHLVPPGLELDDIDQACTNGEAFAPIVEASGSNGLGADNDQLSTLLFATAAVCAEQSALENELRYMRSIRANKIEEAQDARIEQERWQALAAARQYHAYQSFEHYYTSHYNIEVGESCPALKTDFDQMVFMLGAISGLQAIVNDVNSQNQVGVPKDIGGKVERAMGCLDNEKWWGVPLSIRAAIWNIMPGGGPADPWKTLQDAMAIGKRDGVRLPYAIYAIAAYAKDDKPRMMDAFRQYASTNPDPNADSGNGDAPAANAAPAFTQSERYRVFDQFSTMIITGLEDRYWTEKEGHRIPADACLTCDTTKPAPTIDPGDLL